MTEAAATADTVNAARGTIIALAKIKATGKFQARELDPRKEDGTIASLAESLRTVGLLQPIIVRQVNPGSDDVTTYEVIAGHRRLAAAKLAKLGSVYARILGPETGDDVAAAIAQAENAERLDLAPLEEATAVASTVKAAGSIEQAALLLGKPEYWVALRARLAENLSPAWQKALDKGGNLAVLTAGHLELVARLPVAEQDGVLQDLQYRSLAGVSITDFRKWTDGRTLSLVTAPWSTANFTHGDGKKLVGPCDTCPKSTANMGKLFADYSADARCTDRSCFQARMAAHIVRTLDDHRVEEVPLLTVTTRFYDRPAANAPDYQKAAISEGSTSAKKRDGWTRVEALHVDGPKAGRIEKLYIPPPEKAAKGKKGGAKTGKPEDVAAAREDRLERRRAKRVTELLQLRLGSEWEFDSEDLMSARSKTAKIPAKDLPALMLVTQAAAIFGTEYRGGEHWNAGYGDAKDNAKAQRQNWKVPDDVRPALWANVAPVLRKRIQWYSPETVDGILLECRLLCEFFGWSYADVVAQAADELPDRSKKK